MLIVFISCTVLMAVGILGHLYMHRRYAALYAELAEAAVPLGEAVPNRTDAKRKETSASQDYLLGGQHADHAVLGPMKARALYWRRASYYALFITLGLMIVIALTLKAVFGLK